MYLQKKERNDRMFQVSLRLRVSFPLRKCTDVQESEAALDKEKRGGTANLCSHCKASHDLQA